MAINVDGIFRAHPGPISHCSNVSTLTISDIWSSKTADLGNALSQKEVQAMQNDDQIVAIVSNKQEPTTNHANRRLLHLFPTVGGQRAEAARIDKPQGNI